VHDDSHHESKPISKISTQTVERTSFPSHIQRARNLHKSQPCGLTSETRPPPSSIPNDNVHPRFPPRGHYFSSCFSDLSIRALAGKEPKSVVSEAGPWGAPAHICHLGLGSPFFGRTAEIAEAPSPSHHKLGPFGSSGAGGAQLMHFPWPCISLSLLHASIPLLLPYSRLSTPTP
jgi:hypothetical protein